jgi:hypothetical protein
MGYRGKLDDQHRARELRAQAWTLVEIAEELGVAKSSVSLWVRDVEFEPRPRRTARRRAPNSLQRRKQAEIDEMDRLGLARLGTLDEQAFLAAGAALYAGEGAKADGTLKFANSSPDMISFFCHWLRTFFDTTSLGSACSCICTKGSISTPPIGSGPTSPRSPSRSSRSRTAPSRIPPYERQSTCTGART